MKYNLKKTKCTCPFNEDTQKEIGHQLDCPEAMLDILLNRPDTLMPKIFSFTEVRELLYKAIQNERRIWFKEECKDEKNKLLKKDLIENSWDDFLQAYYHQPCVGCEGGHNSFWKTVIESERWKLWQEEQRQRMARGKIVDGKFSEECFDMSECEELGIISPHHLQEFLRFMRQEIKNDLLTVADAGEFEDMRREIERYFL